MDNVLSVAFCHRELGTIQAEGSTRTCTGAFLQGMPLTEPDVRLFRIRLFTKLILLQLSCIYTYTHEFIGD